VPEGDTIHRLARRFAGVLDGDVLARVELPDRLSARKLEGRAVERVFAVGKHLVVAVEGGLGLRTHLGMRGRWERHAPGQTWGRPRRLASAVLATAAVELVLFEARAWEVVRVDRVPYGVLGELGPDLAVAPADVGRAVRRARAEPGGREVAEVLLDQRVACGIGNVYKSEVLFACGLSPWRRAGDVAAGTWEALYATAARWLVQNVARAGGARVTTAEAGGVARGGELWVYERAQRACRRCGTGITVERQGDLARATWWCPACQP
jgi:endonuclease-8